MNNQKQESRNQKRFKISLTVDAVIGNKIVQSTTRDISVNGLYIQTPLPLKAGDDACVVFSLPRDGRNQPIKLYGKSIRVDRQGVAVQFQGLSPYFTEFFEKAIVETIPKDRPKKTRRSVQNT